MERFQESLAESARAKGRVVRGEAGRTVGFS
jgi:hypothetical protein